MKTKIFQYILFALVIGTGLFVASCNKDDDDEAVSTDPIVLSYGPSPALRGGELYFIGRNLDGVSKITLPNNIEVTNFTSKTNEKVTISVPQETVDGEVSVTTSLGVQKMKTRLTISEPIKITTISPQSVRPGGTITITGDYLNLIKAVIFANKKSVAQFVSQAKDKIEVVVPADAQTGVITLSNGATEPILVESETPLDVVTAKITKLTPNPVKAGKTLTIEGTDLDLTKSVTLGGGQKVTTFTSQSATKIELLVPENTQDGSVSIEMASLVSTTSVDPLTMVVPSVSSVAPNPAKNGKTITIKGSDMDLVSGVTFGGNKAGTITAQSETEITVNVPLDAVEGQVSLATKASKTVSTSNLTYVAPSVSNIAPATTQSNKPITITGSNLDLVVKVIFGGNKEVEVTNANETELTVTVPSGTTTDKIVLVSTNGTMVASPGELTILASNVPEVTGFPTKAKPGQLILLTGNKMNLVTDVIFPDGIVATSFGIKTVDRIEVVVPVNVKKGYGRIKFMTIDNEVSETDLINFVGVDDVKDPSLVYFDFNGKNSWWGNVQVITDNNNVDGTSYGKLEGSFNGWTDLFWRNASDNFPGATIGTNINDYVLKMDINIVEPLTGGNLKLRLNGDEGDFWYTIGPASTPSGTTKASTDGWETMTIDISAFKDNYGWGSNSPTDLSKITKEFGMAWDNGASSVKVFVDNVRFERK